MYERRERKLMNIIYERTPFGIECYDADNFDGAPDSHPSARCIGYGDTEDQAKEDLIEQLKEYED